MKNLNKLTLIVQPPLNPYGALPLSQVPYFFGNLASVANDLGRPIDIVAIKISASMMIIGAVNELTRFENLISIGTQNQFDPKTNLFTWLLAHNWGNTSEMDIPDPINETIGDFKTTLFTLKPFTSQLSGGMASEGQLFLNSKIYVAASSASNTYTLNCYITLYYK